MGSSVGISHSAFCQLCGRRIAGEGQLFHHENWPPQVSLRVCLDCARQRPRCQRCGLPMAETNPGNLCETCRDVLPSCLACGRPITGKSLVYNGIGPYCLDCKRDRQSCDVCCAPVTDETWQLSDGRKICAYCQASSVFAPQDAVALFGEIKEILAGRLGLSLNVPTGLALVDRDQLRDVIQQQSTGNRNDLLERSLPEPERTLGVYARRGMRRGVYVQSGLPRTLFLQVAAHEYAHAWQGENCPTLRDEIVREGFAEWIAYWTIGAYGLQESQAKMLERRDVYGQGLLWALELQASQGAQAVIDACRRKV